MYEVWNRSLYQGVEEEDGKNGAYLGLLIFVFYFTSKNLLYYQHLLVNMEQSSKKDLDCEQEQIS